MTPEEGDVRFTRTQNAIYMSCIKGPGEVLWVEGDRVKAVGREMSGVVVPSERFGEEVKLNISG